MLIDDEPIHHFHLDVPSDSIGALLPVLGKLRATPGLSRGEGVLECAFEGYRPVTGEVPTRPRWDRNPLNRKEYLLHVMRRM